MQCSNILITGGTGSLGNAILRHARRNGWESNFTILSRDEVKQSQMKATYSGIKFILGSVEDPDILDVACRNVDVIIHAAAYKQVPSSEVNVYAAVRTNVIGSYNVAMAAVRNKVFKVVGISTDKACAPINAYGKTKSLMESIFQQANCWGDTKFSLCRYGNVIGSRGSIVPFFLDQKKRDVPFTVTDRRMNRFWITFDEAVELVIQAWAESDSGTIIIPKALSMKVVDVAKCIDPAREIVDIGIRSGEKIEEQLINEGESIHTVEDYDFFRIYPPTAKVPTRKPFEYRTDNAIGTIEMESMRNAINSLDYL